MDSSPYSHLLEKTKLPQPQLQRLAVISIFQTLRSAPARHAPLSDPGRAALSRCLSSPSPAVVDQSIHELCRLVASRHLPPSAALLELQSALESSSPSSVPVFVMAIAFVSALAFNTDPSHRPDLHPFVKVLSTRPEARGELIRQVVRFFATNRSVGIDAVLEFLRPFLLFAVVRKNDSVDSALFVRDLVAAVASVSCSFLPSEAFFIISLLNRCIKYLPNGSEEEFRYVVGCMECLVDAFVVVLKQMAGAEELQCSAQACSLGLLESLQSLCTNLHKPWGGSEIALELSKLLLVTQKALGWRYVPEYGMVTISTSLLLTKAEFEHEQLTILKLLIFLVEWKTEKECWTRADLGEDLLLLFPVINLLSSPSQSVKAKAAYLLSASEALLLGLFVSSRKPHNLGAGLPPISKPETLPFRLICHLWFQEQSSFSNIFFLNFICNDVSEAKEKLGKQKHWTSELSEYLSTIDRQKHGSQSTFLEDMLPGMSLLINSVTSILVMHPALGKSAVDSLVVIGRMDPKLGMPLLLSILFYNKMLCSHQIDSPDVFFRLMELLPSVASYSDMVPLVIQTILPMLHKGVKPVLYAAAVRLLCKTWFITDRAFGTLQEVLDPKALSDFISEREICLSIAASVRDVCKHNPDRGVDLILSVSSCIESNDSSIKALGFESLSHLCEADVIDFYTAWDVISKQMLDFSSDPIVAHGLCTLLRWGATDAEVYHEASKNVLQILWEIATCGSNGSLWVKARISAFKSLTHYEVGHVQDTIANFKEVNLRFLTSEEDAEVLQSMEGFEVNIINYEHINRRREHKQKRVMVHKVEKLLDAFPQVIFSPEKQKFRASEAPGAALLSLVINPKDRQIQGASMAMTEVHAAYETALKEIAESLHVSRNIFVALLALQSWQSFIARWMRAMFTSADMKVSSNTSSDKSSKVAHNIFKTISKMAEETIPRVSVNIALAVGALSLGVPASADAVISASMNFLLKWLFDYEHEHKQWSAAISLGLVSNSLHATDRRQRFEVINALLQVLSDSKSLLVKGACGSGLGFACQGLLTGVEADSSFEGETRQKESILLQQIVRRLSLTICKLCPSTSDSLRDLTECFSLCDDDICGGILSNSPHESCDNLEEDAWGVAGLVLGLGYSVVGIYRFGFYDAVLKLKDILISWITHGCSSVRGSFACNEMAEVSLSMGSCLVLPTVVAFCQKVELLENNLDVLFDGYVSLISTLLDLKKTGILYQNLLMTSCIGAGSFLSCILSDGVHTMRLDDVKHLLDILRSTYTRPYPPSIHFGGMLGVVNAFGAGAGNLSHNVPLPTYWQINQKELSFVRGPILSSSNCETLSTSMVQEIFLVVKESKDQHIRSFAAWSVSILRQRWWSKQFENANGSQMNTIDSTTTSQSFAEDSLVWKLCLWLRDLNCHKTGKIMHASTVGTVLRCLSKAPRLPTMDDWGPIIRRCMRYETHSFVKTSPQLLREECICLSLAHARNIGAFLLFLDELTNLSRFRTLDLNSQSTLLLHMPDLLKIYSGLRLEIFYEHLIEYFSSSSSTYFVYESDQKRLLRVSFWKGVSRCIVEALKHSICISMMEKCMERLFHLLPVLTFSDSSERDQADSMEWSEAIRCLSMAREDWLVHILQVPDSSLSHGGRHYDEMAKVIKTRARLVRNGYFPISELGKIKAYILNEKPQGVWWSVLVEVVAAVSTAGVNTKSQWLLDALEISCITEYPSTALQFTGLLSGICSKYMPLLIVDPNLVLSDLPVTLPSLLSDSSWSGASVSLLDKLWVSTERLCTWAGQVANGNCTPNQNGIDGTEVSMSAFLARVMHQTCVSLKDYLPLEKQLRLASMEIQ